MSEEEEFLRPSGPWQLALPSDHGAHPDARAETWMIAAHLVDAEGEMVGIGFSLSRFGLREATQGQDENPWDLRSLYRAHVTLTRGGGHGAVGEERFSRGAGTAGHDHDAREVWLDNWQLSYGEGPAETDLSLSAIVEGVPIQLNLTPNKAVLQTGGDGATPARGFSMTRMRVEGSIGAGDAKTDVSGHAWLDRLWGELPMPGGPLAHDRLVLQLDDGRDLSLIRSRRRDGGGSATVDGLLVDAAGNAESLSDARIDMQPMTYWESPASGGAYPIEWRISGPELDLEVTPLLEDQAFDFALRGWNGTVFAEGIDDGVPVQGRGTLQLTGYEDR